MSDSNELQVLKSIDRKMDQVIKLLAMNAVKGMDDVGQIKALRALDLTFEEIGAFMGTSADAPQKRLARLEESPKSKKGEKSGKQKGI